MADLGDAERVSGPGQQQEPEKIDNRLGTVLNEHEQDFREIDKRIEALPPQSWRDRIQKLEDWERENKSDHLKILLALEAIKARLSIPPTVPDSGGLPFNGGTGNDQSALSSSTDPATDRGG